MLFALHSKVVQKIAAVVKFVHTNIKTLICCDIAHIQCSNIKARVAGAQSTSSAATCL